MIANSQITHVRSKLLKKCHSFTTDFQHIIMYNTNVHIKEYIMYTLVYEQSKQKHQFKLIMNLYLQAVHYLNQHCYTNRQYMYKHSRVKSKIL